MSRALKDEEKGRGNSMYESSDIRKSLHVFKN